MKWYEMLKLQVSLLGAWDGFWAWVSIQRLLNKTRPTTEVLPELEKAIEMTRKAIYLMDKYPDLRPAGGVFIPRLKIGAQVFEPAMSQETKDEAQWYLCMMGKALSKLLREEAAKSDEDRNNERDKWVIRGIGWGHADACSDLDKGQDPRQVDITEQLARAVADLDLDKQ